MDFRAITVGEAGEAYSIYTEAFSWLRAKGVRQWLCELPRERFVESAARGQLFGLYVDGRIAAIVTLALETETEWIAAVGSKACWWIKSLAVARSFGGQKLGQHLIACCEGHIREAGATAAFLDCVATGFLPGYYSSLGYREVSRRDITYRSGNTFPMMLMRKDVPNKSADSTTSAGTSAAEQPRVPASAASHL